MKARRKPQNLRKRSIYLAKEDPHASVKFKTTEEEAGSDEQSEKKIETRAVYSSDQSTVPQDIKKESALVDLEEEFREKESKEKNTQYFKEKRKNLAKSLFIIFVAFSIFSKFKLDFFFNL